jgi:hypothetical protein
MVPGGQEVPQYGKPYVFILKKKISKARGPISIKLSTNYQWVKEILNCSNKGPDLLHRGDNHKNAKIGWGHLNIFLSRTTGPE